MAGAVSLPPLQVLIDTDAGLENQLCSKGLKGWSRFTIAAPSSDSFGEKRR
jgi:hypothetical protein